MKTNLKILTVLLFLNASTLVMAQKVSAQVAVSFQMFYDNLAPYGTWVNYPAYGYAWIPSVNFGFSPYSTNGYWTYTDFGWMWVSNYSWGWAPFHYGRWYFDPMYGWIWIPGNEWAPAWVVWSSAPGYYGWAPLAPEININVVFNGGYRVPDDQWVFVPSRYMGSTEITRYYGPRTENRTYVQQSTIIKNTTIDNSTHVTYVTGPSRTEVEKASGRKLSPVAVKALDKPGQNVSGNEVRVYRPQIQKQVSAEHKPAPQKVVELKDVKPMQERNGNTPKNVTAPKEHVQPQPAPKQNMERKPEPVQDQNQKQKPDQQDQQPNPKLIYDKSRSNDFSVSKGNQNEKNPEQMIHREQVPAAKSQLTTQKMSEQIAKAPANKTPKQNYVAQGSSKSLQSGNERRVVTTNKSQPQTQRQQAQTPEKKKINPKQ